MEDQEIWTAVEQLVTTKYPKWLDYLEPYKREADLNQLRRLDGSIDLEELVFEMYNHHLFS